MLVRCGTRPITPSANAKPAINGAFSVGKFLTFVMSVSSAGLILVGSQAGLLVKESGSQSRWRRSTKPEKHDAGWQQSWRSSPCCSRCWRPSPRPTRPSFCHRRSLTPSVLSVRHKASASCLIRAKALPRIRKPPRPALFVWSRLAWPIRLPRPHFKFRYRIIPVPWRRQRNPCWAARPPSNGRGHPPIPSSLKRNVR